MAYCNYRLSQWTNAIEKFKLLSNAHDSLGQTSMYLLGDCYLKSEQKDKARSAFQSAASMDYDEGIKQNSLFNYGKLSFELGYSTDAIQSFENYILRASAIFIHFRSQLTVNQITDNIYSCQFNPLRVLTQRPCLLLASVVGSSTSRALLNASWRNSMLRLRSTL